jgi:beta-glucosidase
MTAIRFPKNFIWGSATAAYQIEGGYNEDGRGESIWDRYCRMSGNIADGSSGDIACDHYHLYEQDIQLMKYLGLKSYRLSIAWPRIFPDGTGKPNEKGIAFYKNLITLLVKNGIKPAVTLYHWDLPQKLQDIGGWANRQVADYFGQYARYVFKELGDLVPTWITLNEPFCSSFIGYWIGRHAPGYRDYKTAVQAAHNLLLAHGKAVQAYRGSGFKGEIGITLNMDYVYPKTDSPEDKAAAEMSFATLSRWFADPILKGCYPAEVLECYKTKGVMPEIEAGDMAIIHQPVDFLGLNNYYSVKAEKDDNAWPCGVRNSQIGDDFTEMGWGVTPRGLYDLLMRLHRDYDGIKLYITENGAAFRDMVLNSGEVDDSNRKEFLMRYLTEVHHAIQDGVNLHGYYLWSLMDNFEWGFGYTKRFGIVYVDYKTQKRIIKKSGHWYKQVIADNGFEVV